MTWRLNGTIREYLWGALEAMRPITDRYLHYAPEYNTLATIAATPVTDAFDLAQHGVSELVQHLGIIGVEVTLNQWYKTNLDLETMLLPGYQY